MQSIFAAVLLLASLAIADLPVPRNMCGAGGPAVNYGPVLCAMNTVAGGNGGSVILNQGQPSTPAFCVDGTSVQLWRTGTDMNAPISVSWTDIGKQLELAFNSCGGVTRDDKGKWEDPRSSAAGVHFNSFAYVATNYNITVMGSDCSKMPKGVYHKCPYM